MRRYLTIHGHFYQPPREDPWTGRIEAQPSAWPSSDWNARIYGECYGPNAWSRVLNDRGQIEEIVDNYEYFSFNIGPTLMSWIRSFEPASARPTAGAWSAWATGTPSPRSTTT